MTNCKKERKRKRKCDLPCMPSWMACVSDGMGKRERHRAGGWVRCSLELVLCGPGGQRQNAFSYTSLQQYVWQWMCIQTLVIERRGAKDGIKVNRNEKWGVLCICHLCCQLTFFVSLWPCVGAAWYLGWSWWASRTAWTNENRGVSSKKDVRRADSLPFLFFELDGIKEIIIEWKWVLSSGNNNVFWNFTRLAHGYQNLVCLWLYTFLHYFARLCNSKHTQRMTRKPCLFLFVFAAAAVVCCSRRWHPSFFIFAAVVPSPSLLYSMELIFCLFLLFVCLLDCLFVCLSVCLQYPCLFLLALFVSML